MQACGVSFADTADGVLRALTKTVVETALEELAVHLGYDKHDPAGRNGANSRNGTRTKTVLTDTVGQIDIVVPGTGTAGSSRRSLVSVSGG